MSFAQERFNEMLTNRQPDIVYQGFSQDLATTAALGTIVFRRSVIVEGQDPNGVDILVAKVDTPDEIRVYEDVPGARIVDGIGNPTGTAQVVVPGGTTAPFFDETRILLYNGLATIPASNPPSGLPPLADPSQGV